MIDENLLLEIVDNQGWSFPLHSPLFLSPQNVTDWNKFQLYLKFTQYINQDGRCICGKDLVNDGELHHALISRKDVINSENPEYIHSNYNCLVLHHNCHKRVTRGLCLVFLVQIFKFADIREWYKGYPNDKINLRNPFLSEQ